MESALALGAPLWRTLPFGAVVCTSILYAAAQARGINWKSSPSGIWLGQPLPGSDLDRIEIVPDAFGNFGEGRWLWFLRDVERLDPPVPAKGRQGIWEWTP